MVGAERLRALVIDDNAHARAICLMHLRKLGIGEAEEAATGAEAILRLMSAPFGLVILDWYMPDISGAGVMQVLRDRRFGPASATPVILMTAYPSVENCDRARELGVSAVLPKPFTSADLGVALGRVLAGGKRDELVLL
ncbi:response regulator [Devosia sediminis]|uniref:Response regulator n=1 Tax=Devosia sediminis TaxID=2798801 RepID=A0A934IQ62_9HYPH|nr:response regulator [Devosia sediminis]MBJ3784794.1 response regulator [Devosia sediminis]